MQWLQNAHSHRLSYTYYERSSQRPAILVCGVLLGTHKLHPEVERLHVRLCSPPCIVHRHSSGKALILPLPLHEKYDHNDDFICDV